MVIGTKGKERPPRPSSTSPKDRVCDSIELYQGHWQRSSRPHLFHGCSCIFQQDNEKWYSAHIPVLMKERVQILVWPVCSPDLSQWRILKWNIQQESCNVAHPKMCLQEKLGKITTKMCHHLVLCQNAFEVLWEGIATDQSVKKCSILTFFEMQKSVKLN